MNSSTSTKGSGDGRLDSQNTHTVGSRIICASANNILDDSAEDTATLKQTGALYAPDVVVNAGRLITWLISIRDSVRTNSRARRDGQEPSCVGKQPTSRQLYVSQARLSLVEKSPLLWSTMKGGLFPSSTFNASASTMHINRIRLEAVTFRVLLLSLLSTILTPSIRGQEEPNGARKGKVDPDADYSDELPRIAPLSPEDALKAFEIVDGYRIELVASEPLITDPVSISFDERGDAFVVCMRGYSEQGNQNLGEVRRLRDLDGDGKYDTSTLFVDKLSWPTAVFCYDGGAFVGASPDLFYFKDTDGDDRADKRRHLYTGFGRSNVQGLINSLRWGLDNRIHGAAGRSGGIITAVGKESSELDLRGRDFTLDPRALTVTAISGGSQHGASFDDWGHRFVCRNSVHLQFVAFEERYTKRNELLPVPSPLLTIADDGAQAEIFRRSPIEPWRIVRTRLRKAGVVPGPIEGGGRAAGYFTSSTGVTVYRGDQLPTHDETHVFIGDVGSNLVHRKRLTPQGVSFVGTRVDKDREFLASRDVWFRPVQFANAPDGSLYVLDIYREVVEHPLSLPPQVKKHLDLSSGQDRGRIYRVVPNQFKQRKVPNLGKLSTAALVKTLQHPNAWHRETAARLIYTRQDVAAVTPLQTLFNSSPDPRARVHALYALDGLGKLDTKLLLQAFGDTHPRVREHAVKLAESHAASSDDVSAAIIARAQDSDIRVRYAVAFALGTVSQSAKRYAPLTKIAQRNPNDEWIQLAVMSSLRQGMGIVFGNLLRDAHRPGIESGNDGRRAYYRMLGQYAAQIARQRDEDEIGRAVVGMGEVLKQSPELANVAMRELCLGLKKRGAELRQLLAEKSSTAGSRFDELLRHARILTLNGDAPVFERREAIRTLSLSSFDKERSIFTTLLDGKQPPELQIEALAVLSEFPSPNGANVVLTAWPGFSPRVRTPALEMLLATNDRVLSLLDAIDKKELGITDLDPTRIKLLRMHRSYSVRKRALDVLSDAKLERRADVVTSYRKALTARGDAQRGKALFQKICAACHKVDGVGHEVGPNLVAMKNRGAESILVNVFDPNREVNPEFQNYLLVTRDGHTITGMIAAETATSVTLKRGESQNDVVLRKDIATLSNTGLSLMPEGLEKEVDVGGMADLLAYLLSRS